MEQSKEILYVETFSNLNTPIMKNFMNNVRKDNTEATLFDPYGKLQNVITPELFDRWLKMNRRLFYNGSAMVNNKTGEFIVLQNGVWKKVCHCKYRGHDDQK